MKGKYLITTDNWFLAPDGKQYRSAWGEVEVLEDSILGVKTNRNSSNWYAKIGDEKNHIIVAGCQIHYAIRSEEKPTETETYRNVFHDGSTKLERVDCNIYFAQDE